MKRHLSTALWAYAMWSLGSLTAFAVGVPDLLGPVLGIATGGLVWFDPRGRIWARPSIASTAPTAAPSAA